MKTKFKFLTLAVASLLVGFTSCSNDDEGGKPETNTPKNMLLKIGKPSTYAEGAAQGAATATFTSGDLYFTNTAGVIVAHYTISAAATSATNIDIAALTSAAGETITDLPGSITNVHVVGNTAALPTSGTISAVKAQALLVENQANIANVNLFGEGAATLKTAGTPGVSNDLYEAKVDLAPTVARIELSDITATGTAITGFEVEGIFIDNYYSQAGVDGTVVAANLVNNSSTPETDWVDNSVLYPNTLTPSIYDWYAPALPSAANKVAPATAGQVWGYNVFAQAIGTGSAVPRIIIRLNNVTTTAASGITFTGPQFITVKGLLDSGVALTTIEAGKVYNLAAGGLEFDHTNITPQPNVSAIDVEVTVTVADWIPVSVTPNI